MNGHPGGDEHTEKMLTLSRLEKGSNIIDLGAGKGESIALLRSLGYSAVGIDLQGDNKNVIKGDFLSLPFDDHSFDGALAQCSFYVSGNTALALKECARVLRNGGVLMLSDVCFTNKQEYEELIKDAGFEILCFEDMTAQWRDFYISCVWSGETVPCKIKGKCGYFMYICRKLRGE